MKQQGTNPQSQISEEEIGNESEKEFQVMIAKMIQDLRNRMDVWIKKNRKILRRKQKQERKRIREEQHKLNEK